MKLQIIIKSRSRREKITKLTETVYEASVTTPPIEGRANDSLVTLLAAHFKVHKNQVTILNGFKSVNKTVEIHI